MRFLIEFIKEPQVDFEQNMVLNMGQTLSIPCILVGIFFITAGFELISFAFALSDAGID